jgi:two-component system sensor histidine kinase VicK
LTDCVLITCITLFSSRYHQGKRYLFQISLTNPTTGILVYDDDLKYTFTSNADTKVDACLDSTGPSVMMGVEIIKDESFKARNRGVEFRYITEITKDNISYCKELSKIAEIRHLNGVRGNFEVSQKSGKAEYIGTAVLEEAEPVAQLIYSNVKEIVEQQQFVFDTLWNKAIPSQVRIREIEEGIKPETIEVIVDPRNALETEYRLLKSAKQEIQMIFSTVNTFLMQEDN